MGLANAHIGASAARFDADRRAVVLQLLTGAQLAVPIAVIGSPLTEATDAELSEIVVRPTGIALQWPALDADYSVATLIRDGTGMTEIYRAAGATKTPKKAAAARENGKKGGRHRKVAATA